MRTAIAIAKYQIRDYASMIAGRTVFADILYHLEDDRWMFGRGSNIIEEEVTNERIKLSFSIRELVDTSNSFRWADWAQQTISAAIDGAIAPVWQANSAKSTAKPKNNDDRDACYKCQQPTKTVPGAISVYHLCNNSTCEWFQN